MPLYNSPLTKPQLLQKGVPAYLFGNLNMLQGNAKGYVTQTALAANVASVSVSINEGPAPKVGDLVTIWGTSLQTGLFNVTRAVITAVAITGSTGKGTLSFALTGTNQSATADPGAFLCEPGESAETLTNSSFSQAIRCKHLRETVSLPCLWQCRSQRCQQRLQSAFRRRCMTLIRSTQLFRRRTVSASAQTVGPFGYVTLQRGYFYRFAVTGVTGTGTIIAKVG